LGSKYIYAPKVLWARSRVSRVSPNDLLGANHEFPGFSKWLTGSPQLRVPSTTPFHLFPCAASNRPRRPAPYPPTRLPVTSQVHHYHLPLPARLGSGLLRPPPPTRSPARVRGLLHPGWAAGLGCCAPAGLLFPAVSDFFCWPPTEFLAPKRLQFSAIRKKTIDWNYLEPRYS
jgi:hypothetical protein